MNQMDIRPFQQQDLTSLLYIERFSKYAPWNKSCFETEISNAARFGSLILVAVVNKRGLKSVAGYICFRILWEEEYILKISIHPELRHMGIGTALINQALQCGIVSGAERAVLEVSARNSRAVSLYKKTGFDFTDCTKGTDAHHLLVMSKKL